MCSGGNVAMISVHARSYLLRVPAHSLSSSMLMD